MPTILIIGGSGFIGANLAEYFCNQDYQVINFGRSATPIQHKNVVNILGDFRKIDDVEAVFSNYKIDIVVHALTSFTVKYDMTGCQDAIALNLSAFIDLLTMMNKHGVNKIVYLSSGGSIYGVSKEPLREDHKISPVSFYGWIKEVTESYIAFASRINPELKFLILRPANVYGKYQKLDRIIGVTLKNAHLNLPMNIFGNNEIRKDYIHINDFCDIIDRLIDRNCWNNTYNIGSGVGTSIKEIIEIAEKIVGCKMNVILQEQHAGDVSYSILDVDKVKKATGKASYIDVEEGMVDMNNYVLSLIRNNGC
ncbi:NAD-dependent epimerase/dehydratase family protein [Pantoea agglomerans]|uniref:NAD-dependent epimerase/dehydratase family protein n=1 Tax=Enterobacter agglomerans TaxID=549 RepID=UPI003C7A799C